MSTASIRASTVTAPYVSILRHTRREMLIFRGKIVFLLIRADEYEEKAFEINNKKKTFYSNKKILFIYINRNLLTYAYHNLIISESEIGA